jgi:CheY-like chemotaxis protein
MLCFRHVNGVGKAGSIEMNASPTNILLVEDDPNDALLLERAFRRAGVDSPLSVVSDGDEAVEFLQGTGKYKDRIKYPLPNLMLLDLKLPRRSGHEVLKWLRSRPGLKRLPVIVLTSSSEPRDIAAAYEEGTNSYLVKPSNAELLGHMVSQLEKYWLTLNEGPELSL